MHRLVEYGFFFALLGVVGYVVFQMLSPFLSALALAAIIVTICYPVYERILKISPRRNETFAALLSSFFVVVVVFLPLVFIFSAVINETVSIYNEANAGRTGFEASLSTIQEQVNLFLPGATIDTNEIIQQSTSWLAGNLGAIFASTASTIFLFFILLVPGWERVYQAARKD
jgi:predicted PurR-regulated permease PerM